jgi:hypothetical protein
MRSLFASLFAAALCLATFPGSAAFAQAVPKPPSAVAAPVVKATPVARSSVAKAQPTKATHGTVYCIRGLADVFSLGMNTLGDELRAKGVKTTVTSQSYDERISDQIEAAYKRDKAKALPIILIGHSLGANKTLEISARLAKKGIPVRLVVLFDATHKIPVPTNVAEVLNLHKPGAFGVSIKGAAGYKGTIENRDVSDLKGITHINIDKSPTLHAQVVAKVLAVLAEAPKKS